MDILNGGSTDNSPVDNRSVDQEQDPVQSSSSTRDGNVKKSKNSRKDVGRSTDRFVIMTVVGFFLGVVFGFIIKSIPLCLVVFTIIGAAVGLVLDNIYDKKRKDAKEKGEKPDCPDKPNDCDTAE